MTITTPLGRTIELVDHDYASQHDVMLVKTGVDAKFDMLRVAVDEATDFDTLRARLLAVLQ